MAFGDSVARSRNNAGVRFDVSFFSLLHFGGSCARDARVSSFSATAIFEKRIFGKMFFFFISRRFCA